jgi:hypothetical protein
MSRFVLDTDMLSLWQHDHPIVVQTRFRSPAG